MKIFFKGKSVFVDAKKLSHIGMAFGLMFKSKETENLLFEFSRSKKHELTSLFVNFDFVAVYLDENNNVINVESLKPWKFSIKPKKEYKKLIELPVNEKNKKIIEFLVGKGKI